MPYADPIKQREYLTRYSRDVFVPKHKERLRQYQRAWELKNPQKYLWHSARARAKKRDIEFSIAPEDILIPEFCPVFGFPLVFSSKRDKHRSARYDAPSLDRIDPKKGYVVGNVRVISWRANNIKSDGTAEEHLAIARYMAQGIE